jgi:hypothetical protein
MCLIIKMDLIPQVIIMILFDNIALSDTDNCKKHLAQICENNKSQLELIASSWPLFSSQLVK